MTRQVAEKYQVDIKRVSDRPRNPDNRANAHELKIIEQFKAELANKQTPKPFMEGNQLYVSIVTNQMCLQCHGTPNENIQPKVLRKLADLYPNDEAVGYGVNELRGMFRVRVEE